MVAQCWFAPQSELREALVSRVPALDPSLVLDLSQFAPAEREETTGPPPLRPPSSGARPAPARVPEVAEVVDVDEMELSLDDLVLDADDDAVEPADDLAGIEITWGAPDDAEAEADGPVQGADDDELVWDLPVVDDIEEVQSPASVAPQPKVDATIDLGDPGWLTEDPTPPSEAVEEDDPFAPPPPLKPADGAEDDDEFAPPPPLRPADTSDEFA